MSGLAITKRLPKQLIKDFNISICNIKNIREHILGNIYNQTPNCHYTDNANITLNEVCSDGLHLSGKSKYVLINNSLDRVCKNFLEVVQHPRNYRLNDKQVLQGSLQILKNTISNSPKNPISIFDLNSLGNKFNDLRILIQDVPLDT